MRLLGYLVMSLVIGYCALQLIRAVELADRRVAQEIERAAMR